MRFWVVAWIILATAITTGTADAHPLGNFTVNHLSRVRVQSGGIQIRYVVDLAELPSVPILREDSSLAHWTRDTADRLRPLLDLRYDGRPVTLALRDAKATTKAGAGGLRTIRLVALYVAPSAQNGTNIAFDDRTYPGRIGWKDVLLGAEREPTGELTGYPSAVIGSPRANTGVVAAVIDGGLRRARTVTDADSASSSASPSLVRSNALADMLARGDATPAFVLFTFLVAIALGALHAVEPGHGKTLMAVSLVGARATVGQALILGSAITVAHTAGVLALGLVLLFAARYVVPETVYPWITLVSGLVVVAVGARALARVAGTYAPARHAHVHAHDRAHPHAHAHGHDPVAHDHHHDHASLGDEEHARLHAIGGDAPLSFGAVVLAAGTGGIAPCPAALVVLMTALNLHRVGYGLALIVAFSVGLAAVLVGLGIAVVRGASWLGRRRGFTRFVRWGPLVSAGVIATIGAVMLGEGFVQVGVAIPTLVVTVMALAAAGGYAATRLVGHAHTPEAA